MSDKNEFDNSEIEKSPSISIKTISIILAIIVSISSIVGGVITIDSRYVTIEEHSNIIKKLREDIIKSQEDLTKNGKRLFILQYTDELEDLEFKIQNDLATKFEKSKKQRIERRIESIRRGDF